MTCINYKTKTCYRCKISKPSPDFSIKKAAKDGLRRSCKKCDKELAAAYRKTKEGVVTDIYGNQRGGSKRRNNPIYRLRQSLWR